MLNHALRGFTKPCVTLAADVVGFFVTATGVAQFNGAHRFKNIRLRRKHLATGDGRQLSRLGVVKPLQQAFGVFAGQVGPLQS